MIASRRLINLAGTLLVVITLVAGTMLTALPIYLEARTLNEHELDVAASNQLLQAQIDGLRAKEANLPQLEQELTYLHNQLPRIPQLDDATQLVVNAASKTGARLESVQFGGVAPFTARVAAVVTEQLPQTATDIASPPASADASDGDEGPTSVGNSATSEAESTTTSAEPGTAQQLQVPVTITAILADQPSANRFLDGLRAGPRLLQIESINASSGEAGTTLTVAGLVFVSLT